MRNFCVKRVLDFVFVSGILSSFSMGKAAYAFNALHDSLEVPVECETAYQKGYDSFSKLLENPEFHGQPEILKATLDAISPAYPACETFVSAGAFDAQTFAQERVFTEYLFEYSEMDQQNLPVARRTAINSLYEERFQQVGMPEDTLKRVEQTWEKELAVSTTAMKLTLKNFARETAQAIPFGRFIFTIAGNEPLTLFEYQFDQQELLKRNSEGSLEFERGTYNKAAEALLQETIDNAKEYLEWNPSFFWGSDSAISALWHKRESSGRAIKERQHFDRAARALSRAYELNLDPKPFLNIVNTMNKKSKATLEAEIAILNQLEDWVKYELPLFALSFAGMENTIIGLGKAIYSIHDKTRKVGWALGAARAMTTVSRARNMTLGISMSAVGFSLAKGTYEFASDVKDGKVPAQFGHFFSYMASSTFRGISYATYTNTVLSTAAFIGNSAFLGARAILLTGRDLGSYFMKNGILGGTLQIPKLSRDAAKWYLNQWKIDRLKLTYIAFKEGSFNVIFEWGSREYLAMRDNDPSLALISKDEKGLHLNRRGAVSLAGALFMGTVFRPLDNIGKGQKFHPTRLVAWRTAGVATDTASWLMGGYSTERYLYEMTWSFTVGPQVSENIWGFRNSQKNKDGLLKKYLEIDPIKDPSLKNFATEFSLDLALQASLKLPARYAKVYILENYIDGKKPLLEDIEKLKAFLVKEVNPRFEFFAKEDLAAAVERLREYYRTDEGRAFVLSLINAGDWKGSH